MGTICPRTWHQCLNRGSVVSTDLWPDYGEHVLSREWHVYIHNSSARFKSSLRIIIIILYELYLWTVHAWKCDCIRIETKKKHLFRDWRSHYARHAAGRRGAARKKVEKLILVRFTCIMRGATRREQNLDLLRLNCPENAELLPPCCPEIPIPCVKWRLQCEQKISRRSYMWMSLYGQCDRNGIGKSSGIVLSSVTILYHLIIEH